jgi:hypothetical protein
MVHGCRIRPCGPWACSRQGHSRAHFRDGWLLEDVELTPVGHAQKLFIVPYAGTWIPIWLLWTVGTVIPVVEFGAGWMVVVGWRVRECLVALALILMTVTYGHLLIEPLFNFNGHVIPRALMLLAVAFLPRDADWYSIDYLLGRQRAAAR